LRRTRPYPLGVFSAKTRDGGDAAVKGPFQATAFFGALLLVGCSGCSLVDRAGTDLENAGINIRNSADWVRGELGGTPPVAAGHSPGMAAYPPEPSPNPLPPP
jgi:hypothetical protein